MVKTRTHLVSMSVMLVFVLALPACKKAICDDRICGTHDGMNCGSCAVGSCARTGRACVSHLAVLRDTNLMPLKADANYVIAANILPAAVYRIQKSDGLVTTLFEENNLTYRVSDIVLTPTDIVWSLEPVNHWLNGGKVCSVPREGMTIETLIEFPNYQYCQAIEVNGQSMYCAWTDYEMLVADLRVYDLGTGNPPQILHAMEGIAPSEIIYHQGVIFWATDTTYTSSSRQIGATPIDGSSTSILADDVKVNHDSFVLHGDRLVFGNREGLWQVPVNGGPVESVLSTDPSKAIFRPLGSVGGSIVYQRCNLQLYNDVAEVGYAEQLGLFPDVLLLDEFDMGKTHCWASALGLEGEVFLYNTGGDDYTVYKVRF